MRAARELGHQVHHGLCVVTSRPVVGSSAIRSCGASASAITLAHAAGQFERIGVIALAWARDPHPVEDLHAFAVSAAYPPGMLAQHASICGRPCGSD
jgi:hypothetical protein